MLRGRFKFCPHCLPINNRMLNEHIPESGRKYFWAYIRKFGDTCSLSGVRENLTHGSLGGGRKPGTSRLSRAVPGASRLPDRQRNVLDHLAERDRDQVKRRLRRAWAQTDYEQALEQLTTLAGELDRSHPGAAASLREGMAETLTVTRLGVKGSLRKTLASTNPCESMIECVRRSARNVKYWQNGEMCLRWTAAGMLEAEQQFRRIIGYKDLAKLAARVERELTLPQPNHAPTEEAAIVTAA